MQFSTFPRGHLKFISFTATSLFYEFAVFTMNVFLISLTREKEIHLQTVPVLPENLYLTNKD